MRVLLPRRNRSRQFCWIVYTVSLLLIHPSFATFNPLYNPQYHHHQPSSYEYPHEYPQEDETQYRQVPDPRGGSTRVATPRHEKEPPQEQTFHPPKILLKHMSMALRLTSEWNRRLLQGVHNIRHSFRGKKEKSSQPVNINPTRSWQHPISESAASLEQEELTIFHAKAPREQEDDDAVRRGVARWGPELLPYLEYVTELLGITPSGIEIALAMIYLDRACSVDTIRNNGCSPCPFCTPRTVHRLSLVALLLATVAVRGEEDTFIYINAVESSLGIPAQQLELMVEWMKAALGDEGRFVTVGQMQVWSRTWDSIFPPKQQPSQIFQQPQAQIEGSQYHP